MWLVITVMKWSFYKCIYILVGGLSLVIPMLVNDGQTHTLSWNLAVGNFSLAIDSKTPLSILGGNPPNTSNSTSIRLSIGGVAELSALPTAGE